MKRATEATMKHYMDPGSGSCRRVGATAQHLGIKPTEVFVDLLMGANRSPEYLAINPNGMVPSLVDGSVTLWEADVIMIHLAEKAGATPLWPAGAERQDVLRWMFWAAEHFRQGPPMFVEELYLKRFMGLAPDESRVAEGRRRIERFAPILDAQLGGRKFVAGNEVTLADFALAAPLSHMVRAKLPFDPYPNIMAWNARLHEIPAWRDTGVRLRARMDKAADAAGLRFDD
ncbi:MAG: glutathione S-transferase family protein [Rhodospirillales bacterium]|nr:glutathione S-transferase family protein [Rhodospirillales bacterium]